MSVPAHVSLCLAVNVSLGWEVELLGNAHICTPPLFLAIAKCPQSSSKTCTSPSINLCLHIVTSIWCFDFLIVITSLSKNMGPQINIKIWFDVESGNIFVSTLNYVIQTKLLPWRNRKYPWPWLRPSCSCSWPWPLYAFRHLFCLGETDIPKPRGICESL